VTSAQPQPQQSSNRGVDAAAVAALLEAHLLAAATAAAGELARTGNADAWRQLLHHQQATRLLVRRYIPAAAAHARTQVQGAATAGQRDVLGLLKARNLPTTVHPITPGLSAHQFGMARIPQAADMIGLPSVEQITARLTADLQRAGNQVTRSQDGIYRSLVNAVINTVMPSSEQRTAAAQKILDDYADIGIVGLVDKAGRRWNLATYMMMATRTAVQHAATAARAQALAANGQSLVTVSTQVHCCDKCAPFDGQLLSIGPTSTPVLCSLAEAITAGLLHPNCRCDIGPVLPGDALPTPTPPDPKAATVRTMRGHVQRQLRAARRRRAVALSPRAAREALARIRHWTRCLRGQ
jgi:hypothetical protein